VKFLWTLVLTSLFLAPSPVTYPTMTVALTGAYDITVPQDWDVDTRLDLGQKWTTADSKILVEIHHPALLREYWDTESPSFASFLRFVIEESYGLRSFDADEVQYTRIGGLEGAVYTFEDLDQGRRFEHALVVVRLDDGYYVAGDVVPLDGDTLNQSDVSRMQTALGTVERRDVYEFFDGATFDLSDTSWRIDLETLGIIILDNGDIRMDISLWPRYARIAGLEALPDFLGYVYDNFDTRKPFDRSALDETSIAGYDAIRFPVNDETLNNSQLFTREIYAFDLPSNQSYVAVEVASAATDTELDAIYAVLDTFRTGNRVVCVVIALPDVNLHAEPSTSADVVRKTDIEQLLAFGDVIDEYGYRWFVVREGWIRSDTVLFEANACQGLP
jgi:hypothetical protein